MIFTDPQCIPCDQLALRTAASEALPETATGPSSVQPDVADANTGIFEGGPMKVTILAGGIGARLAEETEIKLKPTHDLTGSRSREIR